MFLVHFLTTYSHGNGEAYLLPSVAEDNYSHK